MPVALRLTLPAAVYSAAILGVAYTTSMLYVLPTVQDNFYTSLASALHVTALQQTFRMWTWALQDTCVVHGAPMRTPLLVADKQQ